MLKVTHATDWISIIILIDILLIALLRHYFPKRFMAFIKVPFNATYFTEFAQEKEQPFWFGIILESVMLLSTSLFIYGALYLFNNNLPSANQYMVFIKILLIAAVIVAAQRFFHSLTGLLFNMKKTLTMWMHIKDAYLRWASIILLIVTGIGIYSSLTINYSVIIGAIVLSVFYISGVIRGSLLLAGDNTLNALHIFFYLCTLEILPVIALVKMLA